MEISAKAITGFPVMVLWAISKAAIFVLMYSLKGLVYAVTAGAHGFNSDARRKREDQSEVDVDPMLLQEQDPQAAMFEPADRIIVLRLAPAVAVINLRVFAKRGLVKRDIIVTEPLLQKLMGGRKHNLPDAVFDPEIGFKAIKEESVALAQALINTTGQTSVKSSAQTKQKAADPIVAKPPLARKPEQPVRPKVEKAPVQPVAVPTPAPAVVKAPVAAYVPPVALPQPRQAPTYVPKAAGAVTYEGVLVHAGSELQYPRGRSPYEVFEAKIRLHNGMDVPVRGAELERELDRCGVKIGDQVAITPMGKVPVTLADGSEQKKNLYRVVRLSKG